MKILLDESLPRKLKHDFGTNHDVATVRDMGWLGKKNGALLQLMEENSFELFVPLTATCLTNRTYNGFR